MKTIQKLFVVGIFILLIYGYSNGYLNSVVEYTGKVVKDFQKQENLPEIPGECDSCISIANWNIQTFGKTKWAKENIKEKIISVIQNYDIIFIQEIRDKSGESFDELCSSLEGYKCEISSRAGRTSSKEQYGVIYQEDIIITDTIDYNLDKKSNDFWERPPLRVDFNVNGYEFSAYNIHIKPNDVQEELQYLEVLINEEEGVKADNKNKENVIILGDFNADGFYYSEDDKDVFLEYEWVIDDNIDTTVAKSDNTYDRIIMNDDMYNEYNSKGVYKELNKEVSDHYLTWTQIQAK